MVYFWVQCLTIDLPFLLVLVVHVQAVDFLEIIIGTSQLYYIDGLVQKSCNSIADALELRLSCINP